MGHNQYPYLNGMAMTYYESEVNRIKNTVFANQGQLDTVIGLKNYIDGHLDQDLNLELMAHLRFVSKFHLLRLFKRYYGQTPKQYLIERRVEKAKAYLREGMRVQETCFAVGFESPSSFSLLFKRRTGKSPRAYQKEQFSIRNSSLEFGNCNKEPNLNSHES